MINDNITIFGNIMVTENYDMFKKIGGNRKLNKANYSKIVKSMKEEQLIIPIVVNSDLLGSLIIVSKDDIISMEKTSKLLLKLIKSKFE